jgi:hypothetical protein
MSRKPSLRSLSATGNESTFNLRTRSEQKPSSSREPHLLAVKIMAELENQLNF